ncbi:MAG: transposase [Marinilabiliaceae bacterium]
MSVKLALNGELSKLNCEKQDLCDIVTKYLAALKGGRQLSRLFPKRCGVPVMEILRILCMARILGDSLLKAYKKSFYGVGAAGRGKNSLYRFKSSPKTDWREVLSRMTLRFKCFITRNGMDEGLAPSCFIIDDTAIEKTGRTMERVSKIHDHTDGRYKLGYKLLACAYFDGRSTVCPDFALLRESKRNNYGLSEEAVRSQHSKTRKESDPASRRLSETDSDKPSLALEMVRRLWKRGLRARYVLTDSWFPCGRFVEAIRAVCGGCLHLVCRVKLNSTRYEVRGRMMSAPQIRDSNRDGAKYCKKYKCLYIRQKSRLGDQPVLLFLVRFGRRDRWDALMTTDTSLSFVKCLEIYQIRWNIEVLFKECKQHLGLEDCQSRDFDSQIADISLCFLIHTALTLEKRVNEYESFGGMFSGQRDALLLRILWLRNLDLLERVLGELAETLACASPTL